MTNDDRAEDDQAQPIHREGNYMRYPATQVAPGPNQYMANWRRRLLWNNKYKHIIC